jgi:serine/threonine protein kinase
MEAKMTQFVTGEIIFKPEILIGKKLGKYEVREIIGRGGMAVVFKAWDTLEKRFKCIKMIPPQATADQLSLKKLRREVLNASEIAHPNVIKVFSFEEEEGMYFIVMEYLEGKTAAEKMAENDDDRLPEKEVLNIMKDVASALRESHKRKVIHCDLKPQNIMFTREGEVKVLDFSISFQITRSITMSTGERSSTGTIPYMAPEQLSKKFGRVDEQTDVWGFGATMYHMLSGEPPFDDREQIIDPDEFPYELEGISGKTRDIVFRCLEKDKGKRFKNMKEVLAVLQEKQDTSKKDVVKKLIEKAVIHFDHREYDKAIVVLEDALGIFPGDPDLKQFLDEARKKIKEKKSAAKMYVNRGNEHYRAGDYEQAITLYEKALNEEPDYALAYYNMGAAYDKLDKY